MRKRQLRVAKPITRDRAGIRSGSDLVARTGEEMDTRDEKIRLDDTDTNAYRRYNSAEVDTTFDGFSSSFVFFLAISKHGRHYQHIPHLTRSQIQQLCPWQLDFPRTSQQMQKAG